MKIFDGIKSLALKLGQKSADLHYGRNFPLTDDITQLEALWAENWIAKKICMKRSEDMTRNWREVYSNDLNAEQIDQLNRFERRLKLRETLTVALQWASLYGSVGVLVVTNNLNLAAPLNPKERLEKLIILPRTKISPKGQKDVDVMSDNFGRYTTYAITTENQTVDIHHSRLIIINANHAPLSDNEIWGVSDLEPVFDVLKRFDSASSNIGDLIFESKIDVFKIDGLTDKIAAGMENDVANVISAVQAIKSSTNSLVLDKENEYEQKELAFGGLKDLLTEFRNAVAGAADMPVTILFGQSVSGLASGDEDIQNYHESIHRLQESRLRPVLERLDVLMCNELFGGMPSDWWFEFMPLTVVKQEQQITMLNTFAQAANTLLQNGVLNEYQVANELKESGLFASISADDVENLKDVAESSGSFEEPTGEQEETDDTEI